MNRKKTIEKEYMVLQVESQGEVSPKEKVVHRE